MQKFSQHRPTQSVLTIALIGQRLLLGAMAHGDDDGHDDDKNGLSLGAWVGIFAAIAVVLCCAFFCRSGLADGISRAYGGGSLPTTAKKQPASSGKKSERVGKEEDFELEELEKGPA